MQCGCEMMTKHVIFKPLNLNNFRGVLQTYIARNASTESKNHYDIVIAGGGMVGTTLACTLGKNSKLGSQRILLLEASKEKPWSRADKYSNRVVSLNPGTHTLLNKIGAWKFIESNRYATVKRLQVWDAVSEASITFGDEVSPEDVSYIVENDLLLASVNNELKNIGNVDVLYNAKVKEYHLPEYHEKVVQITAEDGKKFTCDLLVSYQFFCRNLKKDSDVFEKLLPTSLRPSLDFG